MAYDSGSFADTEESLKDYTLLCEAFVALAYRTMGRPHPFHQLVDANFVVEKDSVTGETRVALIKDDFTRSQSNTNLQPNDAAETAPRG
jgi:hypothetical protein